VYSLCQLQQWLSQYVLFIIVPPGERIREYTDRLFADRQAVKITNARTESKSAAQLLSKPTAQKTKIGSTECRPCTNSGCNRRAARRTQPPEKSRRYAATGLCATTDALLVPKYHNPTRKAASNENTFSGSQIWPNECSWRPRLLSTRAS